MNWVKARVNALDQRLPQKAEELAIYQSAAFLLATHCDGENPVKQIYSSAGASSCASQSFMA